MPLNDQILNVLPESWVPSPQELVLFLLIAVLLLVLVFLFSFSGANSWVRKNSRCVREQQFVTNSGQYQMTAVDKENAPLYTVSYDLAAKTFDVACSCKEGQVLNRFQNIRAYNQRNPKNPNMVIPEKLCQCNKAYDQLLGNNIYYSGYPGLLRYYNNGDTSFFTPVPY